MNILNKTYQLKLFSDTEGCARDSFRYLSELGIKITDAKQPIQFNHNSQAIVHRWSSYVQGFSAEFVNATLKKYWNEYNFDSNDGSILYDPFAGSGTVLVEGKMLGVHRCLGTELNPLLAYIANTKLKAWDTSPKLLRKELKNLRKDCWLPAPSFLKSEQHFDLPVLDNLQALRGAIEYTLPEVRDIFKLAFSAILIDCSKLKRTPCLGYYSGKEVKPDAPWKFIERKVEQIAEDLAFLQSWKSAPFRNNSVSRVNIEDAKFYKPGPIALAITSPPYMNGLDYVINYKIEMAWLGFINSHEDAKLIKDKMVVCDNISKKITSNFSQQPEKYTDPWLTEITERIAYNIEHWENGHADKRIPRKKKSSIIQNRENKRAYRRADMPLIVHKYFDDMYKVMKNIDAALIDGGRFVLVLGDSLIADVYVPTDLLIAKMGNSLGFQIESIEKARTRHSGQIRSYKLRETIVTLKK